MRSYHKIYIALAAIVMSVCAEAQTLPALKAASEVQTGVFPNGITYYLVTSKSEPGHADYALVQKGIEDISAGREALLAPEHFDGRRSCDFLASKGVGYSDFGYVRKVGDNAIVYSFNDVSMSDAAASDSTLMMLFDLCASSRCEQAVIVSGDISPETIKGKMSIFSMTVPQLDKAPAPQPYEWSPAGTVGFSQSRNNSENLASLTVTYSSPRTPSEAVGTVQVLVADRMYAELSTIFARRVRDAFAKEGIVLGDVRSSWKGAHDGPGDESFSATVDVNCDDLAKASTALSKVMVTLDKTGVTASELMDARSIYMASVRREAAYGAYTNREYVDMCTSAYLYGTPVRAWGAAKDFFGAKDLPIEMDVTLFNNFLSALLDSYETISMSVDSPLESLSGSRVIDAYMLPWSRTQSIVRPEYISRGADTLKFEDVGVKAKLKAETADPLTGGTMWTFSNGLRVVYKNVPGSGLFNYSFMIRGGYGAIPGIGKGQGAFASDMMDLYDVAGMDCRDFNTMLETNGISMNRKVSISDLRIEGSAPSGKLQLLMKVLASFAGYRRFNEEAFREWRKSEGLRIQAMQATAAGLEADLDAVMRPDYALTQYKYEENLPDEKFTQSFNSYLNSQFSKVNDGIIMIVGDVPADQALKTLAKYAGSFAVSKAVATRPQGQYQLRPSFGTEGRPAAHPDSSSVTVAMSAVIPVTVERYFGIRLAAAILEDRLAPALKDAGLWTSVSSSVSLSPAERLSMTVTARPSDVSGLPEGVQPQDSRQALLTIREAVTQALQTPVTAVELNAAKAAFTAVLDKEMSQPSHIIDASILRYSDGKDFFSKYKATAAALNEVSVQDIFSILDGGCKVEYVMDANQQ